MENNFQRHDEEMLEHFEIEELEQRLEMKLDWSPSGGQVVFGPDGGPYYPIYP